MADQTRILIKNGRIIDPSQSFDAISDLLIENGKITAMDSPGKIPESKDLNSDGRLHSSIIDANGMWVLPGLIDIHVHLREPGFEYKETIETGAKAAVAGGFTSVACMANTQPVNDNVQTTKFIKDKAKALAPCRVFPIGAVTVGLKGLELSDISGMVKEGICAISDDGMPVVNSQIMRKAMEIAKDHGIPVISHAEDPTLVNQGVMNEGRVSTDLGLHGNPPAAEEIMVAREIALCRMTGAPVHIAHISTAVAIEHLRRARQDGLPVTAEACPHHLFLSEENVRGRDTSFKMAPPLRTQSDLEALRKAVAEDLVTVIATDHAPHGPVDKNLEFAKAANGIIGLQTAAPLTLGLVHQGIISPSHWVATMTINPARLLNLPHGSLAIGRDADVTLVDPNAEWTLTESMIVSKSHNSPFFGWKFKGKVAATIVGGKIVYKTEDSRLKEALL
ncbi:MAG: dihydroorotase [Bdellovibrionia bacterium]